MEYKLFCVDGCKTFNFETKVNIELVVKAMYEEQRKNINKYNEKIHRKMIKNVELLEDS
jgi:cell division protein YceG involved in septum cleavage